MSSTTDQPGTDLAAPEEQPPAPAFLPAGSPTMNDDVMAMLWREAKALAAGGMFKDVTQAGQAFAKLVIGHHLGLHPSQAMTGIDIVKGNPQFRGTLLGTFVRSREGYDWKVVEWDDEHCSIEFFRNGESEGISTWKKSDSERAGLLKDDSNHAKYPRSMFWNRAMSQGVKAFVPEVTGGIPVYVEGELDHLQGAELRDGGTDDGRGLGATDLAKVELTLRTHVPEDKWDRAISLYRTINKLAPNSWPAAKVEMTLAGKTPQAIDAELASIEKQIGELTVQADDEGGEAAEGERAREDTSASTSREPTEQETIKLQRLAELENQLIEDPDLTEQQRSDIEAEADAIRGELPPEVSPEQGTLL